MSTFPLNSDEKSAARRDPSADIDNVTSQSTDDKDIAIRVVGEHSRAIDPAAEARVVRKIDLFLIPAMTIGYGLVYYDKVGSELQLEIHCLYFRQS